MRNLPTIRDVAAAAGVGIATVSRVLNNHPSIKPETRTKVLQAVEILGYQPNQLARTMKTQHSRTFGLLIPDIRNTFFPALARGFEDEAHKHGYGVMLADTDENPRREQVYLDLLVENRVAGVAFTGTATPPGRVTQLQKLGMPVVSVNPQHKRLGVETVYTDNIHVATLALKHLMELGHTAIAHVAAPVKTQAGRDRQTGYLKTLQSKGIMPPADWIVEGDFFAPSAKEATLHLLQRHPAITAIFVANDLMAVGALKAIKQLGLSCPGDISVVGVNDLEEARNAEPELTTVATNQYLHGKLLAQRLIRQTQGDPVTHAQVPCDLVVRESTARPRKR